MANIKQQIKRVKTNEKARQANVSFKSSLKTAMKAVLAAVENKDKEKAVSSLSTAYKKLDKAQAKGIVHKNYVARHKSKLAMAVNSLN
ncbi:MAG TPA: 30S ribosomal protein S20 [Candidatus Pelethenecus faecipullorum]|uniref:Small ribosomal subunit protein bS20 n=1 Tax=Candidatus Pelethenecus faecipullorum TaxID=2840900 RepID=A0A9D1KJ13_9MOLU|nr:30S ribosomal protein S20 [Candidatus Pelethenecus faecipullorum]